MSSLSISVRLPPFRGDFDGVFPAVLGDKDTASLRSLKPTAVEVRGMGGMSPSSLFSFSRELLLLEVDLLVALAPLELGGENGLELIPDVEGVVVDLADMRLFILPNAPIEVLTLSFLSLWPSSRGEGELCALDTADFVVSERGGRFIPFLFLRLVEDFVRLISGDRMSTGTLEAGERDEIRTDDTSSLGCPPKLLDRLDSGVAFTTLVFEKVGRSGDNGGGEDSER